MNFCVLQGVYLYNFNVDPCVLTGQLIVALVLKHARTLYVTIITFNMISLTT